MIKRSKLIVLVIGSLTATAPDSSGQILLNDKCVPGDYGCEDDKQPTTTPSGTHSAVVPSHSSSGAGWFQSLLGRSTSLPSSGTPEVNAVAPARTPSVDSPPLSVARSPSPTARGGFGSSALSHGSTSSGGRAAT